MDEGLVHLIKMQAQTNRFPAIDGVEFECEAPSPHHSRTLQRPSTLRSPCHDAPAKITPCLWFNFNAEEAVAHYLSIFKRGRILEVSHYGDAVPEHKGKVLTMRFEIEGQPLLALNGGMDFPFTEAISLMIDCEDQAKIDELWFKLSAGGSEAPCGWLKDKFGLSWQIVPRQMIPMFNSPDSAAATWAMQAMLKMKKLDIAALRAAYEGK